MPRKVTVSDILTLFYSPVDCLQTPSNHGCAINSGIQKRDASLEGSVDDHEIVPPCCYGTVSQIEITVPREDCALMVQYTI